MIDQISNIVEDYYDLPKGSIQNPTRKREVVQARQITMSFLKQYTKYSLAFIGNSLAGKDHATVLHSIKTVSNLKDTDKQFKIDYDEIEKKVKAYLIYDVSREEIEKAIRQAMNNLLTKKIQQCQNLMMMLSQTQTR